MKALKGKILAITTSLILLALAFSINTKQVEAAPVQGGIEARVILNLPEGVKSPRDFSKIRVTPYSIEGITTDVEDMPKIADTQISFYENNHPSDNDKSVEGVQIEIHQRIVENDYEYGYLYGVNTYLISLVPGDTEYMTYSKATYKISMIALGHGTRVYLHKITDDEGNPLQEEKKINYGGSSDTPIVFNNYYDKKDGNENPIPGSQITEEDKKGFALRKTIIGEKPSKTDEFKFKFKLDKPKISKSPDTEFNYYIVKEDSNIEKKVASYNTDTEINLRHNERLVLGKVLLGSKLTVNETNAGLYNGSIKQSKFFESNGQANTGIIGEQEGGNFVEYENQKITPTGLLIDNLPFVLVVLVAGLGIIFFVRNSRKEEYLG